MEDSARELLAAVRGRYLSSREFNGLHIYRKTVDAVRNDAVQLVSLGLVQVVSDRDYINIHIRPWSSARPIADQVSDLTQLTPDDYGVCLYPTALGMKGVRLPSRLAGQPFSREMARGKGTLDLVYFRFDVLEQYRNDPRYRFSFGDSGAHMGVTDESFEDPEQPESDNVGLSHIGFAYDLSRYNPGNPASELIRRVTVFYCDLAQLTPEHQQRWNTYRVSNEDLQPHPLWWNAQMGTWPDGLGPFERLFVELEAINTLTSSAIDEQLFRTSDRPATMGWLLRPSQREWDEFILQLDKLLSENLRSDFFDKSGITSKGPQGQRIGSLNRLARYMERHGLAEPVVRDVLKPLREVRQARQRPAHALRENVQNKTFIQKQVVLLHQINQTLISLRDWFSTHPSNKTWKHPYEHYRDYQM
jgi:hypothetical protein